MLVLPPAPFPQCPRSLPDLRYYTSIAFHEVEVLSAAYGTTMYTPIHGHGWLFGRPIGLAGSVRTGLGWVRAEQGGVYYAPADGEEEENRVYLFPSTVLGGGVRLQLTRHLALRWDVNRVEYIVLLDRSTLEMRAERWYGADLRWGFGR